MTPSNLTHYAYCAKTIRAMEQAPLSRGIPLMKMAAQALASRVIHYVHQQYRQERKLRVHILAGAGNNGGDALFAASILAQQGIHVCIFPVSTNLHTEGKETCERNGVSFIPIDERCEQNLFHTISTCDVLLDAICGIGSQGALHATAHDIIQGLLNHWKQTHTPQPYTIAVDIPSGVGVDDGTLPGVSLHAHETVTFGALKPCLLLPPAALYCGRISIVDFHFPIDHYQPSVIASHLDQAAQYIRIPQATDSKYTRGVLGLITGSYKYPGAGIMSARAAAYSNIGMIRYVGPRKVQDHILQVLPEAVISDQPNSHVQAWTIGSGVPTICNTTTLTYHDNTDDPTNTHNNIISDLQQQKTIISLLAKYNNTQTPPPACIDAGALSMLPDYPVLPCVIATPHAAELATLLARYGIVTNAQEVNNKPAYYAQLAAQRTGTTMLLKGSISVIASSNPNLPLYTSAYAPSWLATAGSGDVLAGITGALLAQSTFSASNDCKDINSTTAQAAYYAQLAASAATVHALAGMIASSSPLREQQNIHVIDGFQQSSQVSRETSDQSAQNIPIFAHNPANTLGMPITASNIIDAIPRVICLLLNRRVSLSTQENTLIKRTQS